MTKGKRGQYFDDDDFDDGYDDDYEDYGDEYDAYDVQPGGAKKQVSDLSTSVL